MAELKIELITIGDEILIGHTVDSNSNWIANKLSEQGFRLRWHSTVGDNASDLRHQIRRAWNRADIVILTGGLGPTHDDITRPVVNQFFDDELVVRPDLKKMISDRFEARGLKAPPGYECMAEFPSRADPVLNDHGSAPGIHYQQDQKDLFALPGVPIEMRGMIEGRVIPHLISRRQGFYLYHIFRTTGIGESHLSRLIGDASIYKPVSIAYLPSIDHGVTIRLSLNGSDEAAANKQIEEASELVREQICEHIYIEDSRSLEEIIIDRLRQQGLKMAIAESCTGGMICDRLVSVPGSSDVFERGFITYSNDAKIELLGVDRSTIESEGAVSEQTASEMAEGARHRAGVDIALSVTGIAGPTGGAPEKPVGLVYIGYSDDKQTIIKRYQFSGNRDSNRRRSSQAALSLLWEQIVTK